MNTPIRHIATEATKLAYPATVASAIVVGITLDNMVKLTAILAALLSAGYTAWKWWHDAHRNKRVRTIDKVTTPEDRS